MEKHSSCFIYFEEKLKLEKIIEDSSQATCPNPECKVKGRKDDNCTHITCLKC